MAPTSNVAFAQKTGTNPATQITTGEGQSVAVKALSTNTGIVWIGTSSSVDSTTGWPLAANESLSLDLTSPTRLYAYSTVSDRVAVVRLLSS